MRSIMRAGAALVLAATIVVVVGEPRSALSAARLNIADGPCAESTSTAKSSAVVARPGGGYIVGGAFSVVGAQTGTAARVDTATGEVDRSFAAFLGRTETVISDGSGGWYIAGSITVVDGVSTTGVVHIGADGRRDGAFVATANGAVRALALAGSTLYLGGSFSTVNGSPRKGLAAVQAATGALTVFAPEVTNAGSAGTVRALADVGGTLYLGGTFTSAGGSARSNIAAIDTSTGLATAWNPGANDVVHALVPADGVLYVAGAFGRISGATNRSRIAAFDLSTGTITAFNPNVSGSAVSALDVEGSTVYVGGTFTLVNGGSAARSNAAAFATSTGVATSWNPGPDGAVASVDAAGSTVYLGGTFTTLQSGSVARRRAAAVDDALGAALAWNPRPGAAVTDVVTVDDEVVLAGEFNCVGLVDRHGLAAIDRTGRLTSWDPSPSDGGVVTALERVGDDLYVAGSFTTMGGQPHVALARVDIASGAVDAWDPVIGSGGVVNDVAVEGDSVHLVGVFSTVGGLSRGNGASVSATTATPLSWDPLLSVPFVATANWQPGRAIEIVDGLVYIGGDFTQVMGGTSRRGLAVFDATGHLHSTDIVTNSVVTSLDAHGTTLYMGGAFTTVLGTTRQRAAAIDLETTALRAWNPSPNSTVSGVTADGSLVYLAGSFSSVGNTGVGGVASRQGVAAVDATTGSASTWNPFATSGTGTAIAVDGSRVYVAGNLVTARRHVVHVGNRSSIALFGAAQNATVGSSTVSAVNTTTAVQGDTVVDTATVTSFDGVTDPTGSVSFYVCSAPTEPTSCDTASGVLIGGPVVLEAGVAGDGESSAGMPVWKPAEGYHLVHAEYSGSSVHEPSDGAGSDSVVHVQSALVVTIPTTTASEVAATWYEGMDPVTDVATVTSLDTVNDPTGVVTFYVCTSPSEAPTTCDENTGTQAGSPVPLMVGTLLDGVSTATLSGWRPPVGHHLVHAVYSGSSSHDPSQGSGTDRAFEVTRREATVRYNGVLTASGRFNLSARVFPEACRPDIENIEFHADTDDNGSYETHVGDAPVRLTGVAGLRWNPGPGVHDIEVRISGDRCSSDTSHAVVVVSAGGEAGTASVVNNGPQPRRMGLIYRPTGTRTVAGTVSWSADGLSRVVGNVTRISNVACADADIGSTCRNLSGTGTVYNWNATTEAWEQTATAVPIVVALADGAGSRRDRFRLRVTSTVVAGGTTLMLPAHRGDVAIG